MLRYVAKAEREWREVEWCPVAAGGMPADVMVLVTASADGGRFVWMCKYHPQEGWVNEFGEPVEWRITHWAYAPIPARGG